MKMGDAFLVISGFIVGVFFVLFVGIAAFEIYRDIKKQKKLSIFIKEKLKESDYLKYLEIKGTAPKANKTE